MATRAQWIAGARPRTLPVAVAPVLAGTGAAIGIARANPLVPVWDWPQAAQAALALAVALALQIGVNYANDYSDGVRGTDDERVGPFRLTGSRSAPAAAVKRAAFAAFGVAAIAGLALIWWTGHWWLLLIGLACVVAAWFYTGGSRPYGYAGLGEASVFVFFGLVAVLGTTYTQAGRVSWEAVAAAIGIGALACAVLVANNLRDVPTDAQAGKLTVAVRIGDVATRQLYIGLLLVPALTTLLAAAVSPLALIALAAYPLAIAPIRAVAGAASGLDLLPVLRDTGRLELVFAALLAIGLAL